MTEYGKAHRIARFTFELTLTNSAHRAYNFAALVRFGKIRRVTTRFARSYSQACNLIGEIARRGPGEGWLWPVDHL